MKRVDVNSSHQSQPVDQEARLKFRHESLLQDFLDRQKEFVSKKKKLQAAKQKRDILLAEIQFLRRRHSHLLKIKAAETKPEVGYQNSDIQPKKFSRKRKNDANEAVVNKTSKGLQEGEGGEQIGSERIRVEKKPKNCLNSDKNAGKKKIALQDQVALNA